MARFFYIHQNAAIHRSNIESLVIFWVSKINDIDIVHEYIHMETILGEHESTGILVMKSSTVYISMSVNGSRKEKTVKSVGKLE